MVLSNDGTIFMLLTIDIGNTSITLGIFDEDILIKSFRLTSDKNLPQTKYESLLKTLVESFKIEGCIIASVVEELNIKFKHAVENILGICPLFLTHELNTGVKIVFKAPHEAGADRIANACAVFMLYKKPCIAVDFGTATSFDIVNKKGEFIGGIITPGLNLQMKVLNKFTSKLPKIEVATSKSAIGKSTRDAILSGVIRGSAAMIDGLIAQCEKELGYKAIIVATGGYSGLISGYMKRPFDFINPDLTLNGLNFLYKLNQPSSTPAIQADM